jgi:putative membrane protein
MITAFVCSSAFLVFYLYFHISCRACSVWRARLDRPLYLTLLTSHTILAATIVPPGACHADQALRERFDRHRTIARWSLPLWFCVLVTGVVICWLLYIAYTPIGAPA